MTCGGKDKAPAKKACKKPWPRKNCFMLFRKQSWADLVKKEALLGRTPDITQPAFSKAIGLKWVYLPDEQKDEYRAQARRWNQRVEVLREQIGRTPEPDEIPSFSQDGHGHDPTVGAFSTSFHGAPSPPTPGLIAPSDTSSSSAMSTPGPSTPPGEGNTNSENGRNAGGPSRKAPRTRRRRRVAAAAAPTPEAPMHGAPALPPQWTVHNQSVVPDPFSGRNFGYAPENPATLNSFGLVPEFVSQAGLYYPAPSIAQYHADAGRQRLLNAWRAAQYPVSALPAPPPIGPPHLSGWNAAVSYPSERHSADFAPSFDQYAAPLPPMPSLVAQGMDARSGGDGSFAMRPMFGNFMFLPMRQRPPPDGSHDTPLPYGPVFHPIHVPAATDDRSFPQHESLGMSQQSAFEPFVEDARESQDRHTPQFAGFAVPEIEQHATPSEAEYGFSGLDLSPSTQIEQDAMQLTGADFASFAPPSNTLGMTWDIGSQPTSSDSQSAFALDSEGAIAPAPAAQSDEDDVHLPALEALASTLRETALSRLPSPALPTFDAPEHGHTDSGFFGDFDAPEIMDVASVFGDLETHGDLNHMLDPGSPLGAKKEFWLNPEHESGSSA
ncbi:hypothetical protein BD413DRAFT_616498 [Trametes elegans]|nr:hypothetical protein BD413DRAFT_616498 [Trametes elegans]